MLDFNNIEDKKLFSDRLKQARIERGLTQRDFAKQLNVSRETVTQWESARNLPEYITLSKICSVLDVDCSFLFGEYFETKFIFRAVAEVFGMPENATKKLYINGREYVKMLSELLTVVPSFDSLIKSLLELKKSYEAAGQIELPSIVTDNEVVSPALDLLQGAIVNIQIKALNANKKAADFLEECNKKYANENNVSLTYE